MSKGFTLVELIICIAIVSILATAALGPGCNNRKATEDRAYVAAEKFVAKNKMSVKRLTCAGDSDNDGYGSCTMVTSEGEKIMLKCPTDYFDVNLWGAEDCKEQFTNIQVSE